MSDMTALSVEQRPDGSVIVIRWKASKGARNVQVQACLPINGKPSPEGAFWLQQAALGAPSTEVLKPGE